MWGGGGGMTGTSASSGKRIRLHLIKIPSHPGIAHNVIQLFNVLVV